MSRFVLGCVLVLLATPSWGADLVSPFAGSEYLGTHETDFVRYAYLPSSDDGVEPATVEGRLSSRLFRRPEEKSNFEVLRSYENELRAAGFEVLAVMDPGTGTELKTRRLNSKELNDLAARVYTGEERAVGVLEKARVATQADHYISARKKVDRSDVLVAVAISRDGFYAVEVLESAAMEEDTVVLSVEVLRSQMDAEGRVAIYGIHFDTGSATIRSDSAATIATIVQYLGEHPDRSFYVVGHTDDEGTLDGNLELSKARAESTVAAIVAELPAAANRLQAHGVGPLSPVATNQDADGRQLNRRVELVSTLE